MNQSTSSSSSSGADPGPQNALELHTTVMRNQALEIINTVYASTENEEVKREARAFLEDVLSKVASLLDDAEADSQGVEVRQMLPSA